MPSPSNRLRWTLCLALAAAAPLAGACNNSRSPQVIEVNAADLPPSAGITPGGGWQSVGWLGDTWQRYPGRATIVMEHGLGEMPASVNLYVSFEPDGTGSAPATGDMTRIVAVDEDFVSIRNDTNADFYLRVVLH